jgi:dTDP-4-dehydrorhamnose reductase
MDAASAVGQAVSLARGHADHRCDLCDADAVRRVNDAVRPDIVLHAAAMTDVDQCERNPGDADRANHMATANLADALAPDTFLVAYSTIAVYPDSPGPHVEGGEAPVNVYGTTKLAGEHAALRHERSVVLRTMLFGPSQVAQRMSFSDTIIKNLREGRPITLFSDVLFSPLHLQTLATITMKTVSAGLTGVYNVATRDGMSKAEFGFAIAAKFNLATDGITVDLSTSMPDRAPRATDTRLDAGQLEKALGCRMPTIAEEIARL